MRCRELVKLSRYLDNELSLRDREAMMRILKPVFAAGLRQRGLGR